MALRAFYKLTGRLLLQPLALRYLRSQRSYRHRGMRLTVLPGVFHPGLFISTKLLVRFLSGQDLAGRRILELGCGSGMVSVFAALQGAVVTASDINPAAIENTRQNALLNGVELSAIYSDLFGELGQSPFDMVIINPPYYPREPQSDAERAWYCGAGYEYFEKLFAQLAGRKDEEIYMILSEDCDVERIRAMGADEGLVSETVFKARRRGETNWIFRFRHK